MRLAGLDDCAVDDSRRDRRDLAGDHRGHRLVEEGDSAASLGHGDQRLTATEAAHRSEVRVIEPLGDGGDLLEYPEGVGRAPGHQGLERLRDQQEPRLDPVVAALLREARPAGEPAASLSHLTPLHVLHPEPVRRPNRQPNVARPDGLDVGSRSGRRRVVGPPEHVRGDRQPLEVLAASGLRPSASVSPE